MAAAVEIRNLSKRYGRVAALSGLSLTVEPGEIFGLIGPNGAGKSTALKILTTLLKPTSGSARVFGLDVSENPAEVRKVISYLPEEAGSYKQLTGREYLEFMAGLLEPPEGETVADMAGRGVGLAGLGDRIDDRTKEYSKGMRRKLLIARAFMSRPALAILDEPTSGLDVRHAFNVRGLIKEYARAEGAAVILSSHNMLEVEYLCDRVSLLDNGVMLGIGTPAEVASRHGAGNLEEAFIRATGSNGGAA